MAVPSGAAAPASLLPRLRSLAPGLAIAFVIAEVSVPRVKMPG